MANTITIQDIPKNDKDRYYKFVQARYKKNSSTGKYIVDYRLRDLDGNYIKHSTKTFELKRDAETFIGNLKDEHAVTLYKKENPGCMMTFADVCSEYLEIREKEDKRGTIINRRSILNSRILPYFGDMYIKDITKQDIIKWQNCFRGENNEFIFTHTYLHALRSRLSAIFNFAVEYEYISSNPIKHIKLGSKNAPKRPVWNVDEYKRFISTIEDRPLAYYAFEVLYGTGLRRGELMALTLNDIDLQNGVIFVRHSLSRLNGQDVIHSPKTKCSVRNVKIGKELCAKLKEHIETLPEAQPDTRIFPVSLHYLRSALAYGTKAAGLHPITIHCFRHSHISNLILRMGEDYSIADIAERVGHETEYITHRYMHGFKDAHKRMADAMDDLLK